MTIKIYSPEGRVGASTVSRAQPPAVLAGQRLLVLDNGKPGAALLMQHAAEKLAERTGARYVGTRRKRTAATPCEDVLLQEIIGGADIVITGTAD